MIRAALTCALVLAWAAPAGAVLGQDQASVQASAVLLKAERRADVQLDQLVHTLHLPDGSVIQEHANQQGRIFRVAWRTRYKPRLALLLGEHHLAYQAALRQQAAAAGLRRQAHVSAGDLWVRSGSHLQVFTGVAELTSQTPEALARGLRR